MKGRVLVAYETSKGSTAEIAEVIAAEIRTAGWDAEAVDVKDSPLPADYSFVVVGGPIYLGSIKGVKGFVERHKAVLQERLIGAFAVGMSFAVEDEEKQAAGRKALDEAIAPLEVAHLGYFAGKIDMEKLSFLEKMAVKMVKSPVGDFRDWDAVKGWAQEVLMAVNRESGKP
ncbi:MAG TPA: flavodoxin domain-containing protein [Thermovirgaceae bacterium]|nr:flavodoxin domain-containing protein [Thermovirgaceae bacterium]